MVKKISIATLLIPFVLFLGCNKDDISEKNTFDVLQYHQMYAEKLISPQITKFVSDVTDLNEATKKFTGNTSEDNLLNLKQLWKNTAISFSKTEIGNLGDVQASAIYLSIYSWGANELKIEEFIASTAAIEEVIINGLPTKARGLSAIEYLLFNLDLTATVTSFSELRRKEFLIALNENLLIKSISLKEQWENYSESFINNTSTGINGSINLIVNQLNFLLEDVVRFKIGEAAGLEDSTNTNPTLLQAYKSEISLEIIKENITATKSVYYGMPEGLDDYISTIAETEDINKAVAMAFSTIESNIASLSNTTLKNAIENNNLVVNELFTHIKDLIILIKVDVASALSITVTFTDNDGD